MRQKSFADMECPVARTLDVIGEWWSMLILRDAFRGIRRFADFQESLGIARNILSRRLRKLVAAGVLEKRVYAERPRRFEYRLTEKGRDLFPVIVMLMAWGNRWAAPGEGPTILLVDRATARPIEPIAVDGVSGRKVAAREVTLAPGPGAGPQTHEFFARIGAGAPDVRR